MAMKIETQTKSAYAAKGGAGFVPYRSAPAVR